MIDVGGDIASIQSSLKLRTTETPLFPALSTLHSLHHDIQQLVQATESSHNRLVQELREHDRYDFLVFQHTDNEEHLESLTIEEFPFGYSAIQKQIVDADSPESLAEAIREVFEEVTAIQVPVHWMKLRSPVACFTGDTTHQDTRDAERDHFVLNNQRFSGSKLTYEGVISVISAEIAKVSDAYMPMKDRFRDAAISRFARSVLHVGNRTCSGGNAFEALMTVLGSHQHILVVPNSEQADPVQIEIRLGSFQRKRAPELVWGVVAEINGNTKYMLKDPVDIETSVGGLCANFKVSLGMQLPVPLYQSSLSEDNRRSAANKESFTVWEGSYVQNEGFVDLYWWNDFK